MAYDTEGQQPYIAKARGTRFIGDFTFFFFWSLNIQTFFILGAVPLCGRAFLSPRANCGNSHVPSGPELMLGPPKAPAWDFESEWEERKIQRPLRNVRKVWQP